MAIAWLAAAITLPVLAAPAPADCSVATPPAEPTCSNAHYLSVDDGGTHAGNYDNDGATGKNSVAIGVDTSATKSSTTAIGHDAQALGNNATAIGFDAVAMPHDSIAIGTRANVTSLPADPGWSTGIAIGQDSRSGVTGTGEQGNGVAIGTLAQALTTAVSSPVAVGFAANASGAGSQVAIGDWAVASGVNSVAIGGQPVSTGTEATGDFAAAIGPSTHATGNNTVSMGRNSLASGLNAVAIGGDDTTGATASADDSIALGARTSAAVQGGIAIGAGAQALDPYSTALGVDAVTTTANPVAGTVLLGSHYTFAGSAPLGVLSIGAAGSERQLTNVAAGQLGNASTDAVNGSQLYATNQALAKLGALFDAGATGSGSTSLLLDSNHDTSQASSSARASGATALAVGERSRASGAHSTAVGTGTRATGSNSVALGAGSVADRDASVSVGSTGHERTVSHVAAGVASTDAVNVGQMHSATTAAVGQANAYTDQRFSSIKGDMNRIGNRANAGIASAIAAASLPQPYAPNQSSLGVGIGSFHGETAIAIGLARITPTGRFILKANFNSDSRGDIGAGVGAGIVW